MVSPSIAAPKIIEFLEFREGLLQKLQQLAIPWETTEYVMPSGLA